MTSCDGDKNQENFPLPNAAPFQLEQEKENDIKSRKRQQQQRARLPYVSPRRARRTQLLYRRSKIKEDLILYLSRSSMGETAINDTIVTRREKNKFERGPLSLVAWPLGTFFLILTRRWFDVRVQESASGLSTSVRRSAPSAAGRKKGWCSLWLWCVAVGRSQGFTGSRVLGRKPSSTAAPKTSLNWPSLASQDLQCVLL